MSKNYIIKNLSETHSQAQITYLSREFDVYDENKTKAKIIKDNMPKKPLQKNKIEDITNSQNKFDLVFLIMSHDGANDYNDRQYKKEALIYINKYIDINNKIINSFIQERLDNSQLYQHVIKKQVCNEFLNRDFKYRDTKRLYDFELDGQLIVLSDKKLQEQVNQKKNIQMIKKKKYMVSIQKLKQKNSQYLQQLKQIGKIASNYEQKKKELKINLEDCHQAKKVLFGKNIKDYTSNMKIGKERTFLQHIYALINYKESYNKSEEQIVIFNKQMQRIHKDTKDKMIQLILDKLLFKNEESILLRENELEQKIKKNNSQIEEYKNEMKKINNDFKAFISLKYKTLQGELNNFQLSFNQRLLLFQVPPAFITQQQIVFLCPIGMKSFDREQQYRKIMQIHQKIKQVRNSRNGHSEDIINYIDYYQLYQDIKASFKEEKNYTVNTLMYSYNSICNSNQEKGCEKKLKFIQQMLKYMDENDVHRKDNKKALTHRNVGHVNFSVFYNKVRMEDNFNKKKQSKKQKINTKISATSHENSSVTNFKKDLSLIKPRSLINSDDKLKIYSHWVDEDYSIKSLDVGIKEHYEISF